MSDKPPITIFDMQTLPLLFQIIKAMIPFLDFPMAKMLSVIIRLITSGHLIVLILYHVIHPFHIFIQLAICWKMTILYVPFFLTARLNMPDLSKISSFFPICHQCLTVIQTH